MLLDINQWWFDPKLKVLHELQLLTITLGLFSGNRPRVTARKEC